MAAWQADFMLVPPSGTLSPDYRARLGEVLPPGNSWSDDIELWGTEDGDRIEVSPATDGTVDLWARFDMRAPDSALCERFLSFVRLEELKMCDMAGRPVAPVLGEFVRALRRSLAFRFVTDPEEFFRRLRIDGLTDG